jgi:hypothetical protein
MSRRRTGKWADSFGGPWTAAFFIAAMVAAVALTAYAAIKSL